jgi:FG-GAP-like repeat
MTRYVPLILAFLSAPLAAQDVPLEFWTNATWPAGLPVGETTGVSWGDLDGDGWPDFYAARSGRLWHNLGGVDWELIEGVTAPGLRYGSSIADYDNDGLADIATEPRAAAAENMKLLRNLGGLLFVDVAGDPNIVDVVPQGDTETICWSDVDFDGNLDCFVPAYPSWALGNGPGNFFLHNLGPSGPGGAYRFEELSAQAGLDNPPGTARPEGAMFCDVDGDGDPDLVSNDTLYVNRSLPGRPRFVALTEAESGIRPAVQLDEGLALRDYDLDGDPDLIVAFCGGGGVRVFENRGDGTFKIAPKEVVEDSDSGVCLGLSMVDWDNDGDWDLTTQWVWRRNMLMETGQRGFRLASHNIANQHLVGPTPAWADWDRDGDLDCALGNWMTTGYFYGNDLYGPDTPDEERRYVRVRVARDRDGLERGLETEYGAVVELHFAGGGDGFRRRHFVTSSGGYLNQDEYVLHFALPADPSPGNPDHDLAFDLSVDFTSDPARGLRRVDKYVNPQLGAIELSSLVDREIVVFRSGRVTVNGCTFRPTTSHGRVLTLTTDGLVLPDAGAPLPDTVPAPAPDWYVGQAFDTTLAGGRQRLKEVLLDGRLDQAMAACAGQRRLALWDVTDGLNPVLVDHATATRIERNDRNAYPVDMLLEPGRQYRLVARVDRLRPSPIAAPVVDGALTTHGGLSFADPTPCEGTEVLAAAVNPGQVYLALRFTEDGGPLWVDLGHALAGSGGPATLRAQGELGPGDPLTLGLSGAPANVPGILVMGLSPQCQPMAGGVLVPSTDVLTPLMTNAQGQWTHTLTLPPDSPAGTTWYFQAWWLDAGAPRGRAASNALSGTAPF